MAQAIGRTYGFGRVSPSTRPSPYSPVHVPSAPTAPPDRVDPHLRRRQEADAVHRTSRRSNLRRGLVAFATLVVLSAGTAFLATLPSLSDRSGSSTAKPTKPPAAPAMSAEAERLKRSAIAVSRTGS